MIDHPSMTWGVWMRDAIRECTTELRAVKGGDELVVSWSPIRAIGVVVVIGVVLFGASFKLAQLLLASQ